MGVARQYIGQVGKVYNAQVGVFAALVRGERVGIVNARLYLPAGWSADQPRCKAAGMPTAHQVYQTKAELAVLMLTELEELVTYDWVGGDSIYGNSPTLRAHLLAKKQAFVLDVGQELGVYRQDPTLYLPAPPVGRGRKPTRLQTDQKRVSLHSLLAQQSDADWQTLPYRVGSKGKLVRQAVLVPVWVWNPHQHETAQPLHLRISRLVDDSEVKYSLVYAPDGSPDLPTSLHRQMQRYGRAAVAVKRGFQDIKQELGLSQNQTRSWIGWYHHVALTMMAGSFQNEMLIPIRMIFMMIQISL